MTKAVEGGTIEFSDIEGEAAPKFSATRDGQSRTRIGIIDYSDWEQLLEELWPDPQGLPSSWPGYASMYVKSVSGEPIPAVEDPENYPVRDQDVIEWEKMKVTIEYGTLDGMEEAYPGGPLFSHSKSHAGHILQLPSASLYWESDSEPVKQQEARGGKMIPTIEHTITIPLDFGAGRTLAVLAAIGKINGSSFLGATAGTLLYIGGTENVAYDYAGARGRSMTHKFRQIMITGIDVAGSVAGTWNHIYRPDTGAYDRPLIGSPAGNPLYETETTEFDALWS